MTGAQGVTDVVFLIRRDWRAKPGGDTVQLSLTRQALQECGVESRVLCTLEELHALESDPQAFHVFNLDRPLDIQVLLDAGRKRWPACPILISTIHHREKWVAEILRSSPAVRDRAVVQVERLLGSRVIDAAKELRRRSTGTISERVESAIQALRSDMLAEKAALLQRADAVVVLGEMEVSWLQEDFGFDRSRVATHVVPNGFDLFAAPDSSHQDREGIIQIARIEPRKNQFALARLARRHRLPVTFVGGINENFQGYARAFSREVHANPNARWLGQVAREELPSLLARHRLHVLPSLAEVLPLVDFEAIVCGCAVLTTQRSCAAEYLQRLPEGFLWKSFAPEELTLGMIEDCLHQQSSLSERDRAPVLPLPTWRQVAEQLQQIYWALIAR